MRFGAVGVGIEPVGLVSNRSSRRAAEPGGCSEPLLVCVDQVAAAVPKWSADVRAMSFTLPPMYDDGLRCP